MTESNEWRFLAKRMGVPPVPSIFKMISMKEKFAFDIYKTHLPMLVFWSNNLTEFRMHTKEHNILIEYVNELLKSKEKTQAHIAKLEEHNTNVMKACKFFHQDLSNISEEELFLNYEKVIEEHKKSFIYGFITWCTKPFEKKAIKILEEKKLEKINLNAKSAFSMLVVPPEENEYQKKERALDILSKKLKESNLEKIKEDIHIFLETYGWIGYDYMGPFMTYDEVVSTITNRNLEKKEEIDKNPLLDLLSDEEKKLFEIYSLIAHTKDTRNISDDYAHYSLDIFFKEIAKRNNTTHIKLRHLWPHEFKDLMLNKKKFTEKYLDEKVNLMIANTALDKYYYVGEEAKQFLDLFEKETDSSKTEFEGTSASPGIVRGIATVIKTFDEVKKMKKDHILVAYMTSPRFMEAMNLAKAFVTNEGGLTCHAAIIAREMKKPCVVGVKGCVDNIKDGDLVEVDATTGTIKILDKK